MTKNEADLVTKLPKDHLLSKLTIFFFDRPRLTAVLWVALVFFGVLSYTTLLSRQGFPSVNIPYAFVQGAYFVNDPAKVDSSVANPISQYALKQGNTSSIQAQSAGNFFTVAIQYKDGTDAKAATNTLEKAISSAHLLPSSAHVQYNVPYFGVTGGDPQQIDMELSFYSNDPNTSLSDATANAQIAAKWLNNQKLSDVKAVFVKSPFTNVTDPITGQVINVQQSFDRFGIRSGNQTTFHSSIVIGITKNDGVDAIKLDTQVRKALTDLNQQPQFRGYSTQVSASYAPTITSEISELQRVLLEGLIAVLVIGSLVIAIRASFITVASMVTVLVTALGFLYLIGYSLNVITLFALILGLALIVDDTIIMVEAIDAARRKHKDPRVAVSEASRKISRAMVAATSTAALSFVPLLFVGGILGSFIRAIPITLISALIISLLVALIFIPFFARIVLLGKKQMGEKGVEEVAAGFEAKLAQFIARPMLWGRNSRKKLFAVGMVAVVMGFGFTAAGILIAKNVVFNIFPPSKNTNTLSLMINFPPSTTVQNASKISGQADTIVAQVLGNNFIQSTYYNSGGAQTASEQISITSYSKRSISSPELVKQIQSALEKQFNAAKVSVAQVDTGPPSSALVIEINSTNRQAAFRLAHDLNSYLDSATLTRTSGKTAHFTNVSVSSSDQYIEDSGKPVVTVSSSFDGNDTTTLVNLAQSAIKQKFSPSVVKSYGLSSDAMFFNIGFESQNQNSFKTLALAFPVLLCVIFVLLAFEFRSLLQPLLIFMAIPFSIFGVMLGLDITNNAISFFSLLGFFALVGLSIKNTILLTDFANQARRSGLSVIDSAVAALEERFRPLFATSVTAVVSLIPLAITSPFWQGLAVVLIFGLISSTFLVVTVFPYYYLGVEYLRSLTAKRRRAARTAR
jgi:multidrug efflux pump subunit AcrB